MTALARFLRRQEKRAASRVDLAAALLSRSGLRYLFVRGWVLFARLPLRVGLHVAEVIVLSDFIELGVLGYLLALRSIAVALGALHWGALEPLRQAIRAGNARGERAEIELEIVRYLRISLDFCVVLLIALVAGLELLPRPFESFSIVDAYAIGCGVRAMSEAITRTYHSGVFALRRIYRPLWAALAVDVVDVGTTLVLWPWLGAWGFAVAQLVGGVVEATLTLVFTRRAYAALGLTPPTMGAALSDKAKAAPGTWRRLVPPALGNLVSQLDALLITALAFSVSQGGLALAAGLHVLRPVLSLSGNWARLFYFDLSRLEGSLRSLFRARLERLLLRAAPVFALLTAVSAVLTAVLLDPSASVLPVLWFLPFLVARFVYAVTQIQAFARGRFGALLGGAALVGALVVIVPMVSHAGALLALVTVTLLVAALAFRFLPASEAARADATERLLRPLTFLGVLVRAREPISLRLLVVPPDLARASGVARAISELPSTHWVTRMARRRIVVAGTSTSVAALVEASGGSLRSVSSFEARDGAEALRLLIEKGWIGEPCALPATAARLELELRRDFARLFPRGTLLSGADGALTSGAATPRMLTATLAELRVLSTGSWLSRRRGVRAAVYAPNGDARLIFVAGVNDDATAFADFERSVFKASVLAGAVQ